MDKKFVEAFSTKNSNEIIKLLEPLIFTKLKGIPTEYINDMYQENVLTILEYLNKDFETTSLEKYLIKKGINFKIIKKGGENNDWNTRVD